MIAPWLLHRSADLWDRPNHFLPERFPGTPRSTPSPTSPSPWDRGSVRHEFRPGRGDALLAILAQQFEVVPAPRYKVAPICRLTLRPDGGLPVTVKRRAQHAPSH